MFRIGSSKIHILRHFNSDPKDVAVAFMKVAAKRYGESSICGISKLFFGSHPLTFTMVKNGYNENEETKAVVGPVAVKSDLFTANFIVCPENEMSDFRSPKILCFVTAQCQKEAEDFLNEIQDFLAKHSIYRGKAITAYCEFMNISGIDSDSVIYSAEVLRSLKTHLWTIIEQPERCTQYKIKRQRKILLEGPPGSGKTLTALLTAKKATEHGWTFVYLPPTDKLDSRAIDFTFSLAQKYQPAVIFIEDIDYEQRMDDIYTFKTILATLDGIVSKNDEIIVVMTTNQTDRIQGALQRPGRIDKIIKLGILAPTDIKNLISSVIQNKLEENINWEEVAKYCLNYPPAFIREVATNALLSMISEEKESVSTELLVQAARDLHSQFEACATPFGFRNKK